ncbi:MAG: CoA-binding protein [Dehalococcoidia bacterium]|nr:CoA-binding protein [Dehalococcoidia bacterium]
MPEFSLDSVFKPSSIAIAGVSQDISTPNMAQRYAISLWDFGFKGKIYPVHPSGGRFYDIEIYRNIKDIPGPVDLLVSAIPARFTPQLIEDACIKGVKAVHLFTSGYSEIEDEIGKNLEKEILRIARKSGVRIIGPNCMGIYNPQSGLTFASQYPDQTGFPQKPGTAGLISQSGGNCIFCIRDAFSRDIFFSKAISYGNAADLNETDYLEYMADDPDTKIILMYIEGVKDGKRFSKVLRRAASIKPIVINKGGTTETGARTCASHTSAVAGKADIWHDLIKQAGAIQVNSMSELVDVALIFNKFKRPAGKNVALFGVGGGIAVQASDEIAGEGLHIPLLHGDIRKGLHNIYGSEAGSIFRNPIDMSLYSNTDAHVNAVKLVSESSQIDIIMMQFPFDMYALLNRRIPASFFTQVVTEITRVVSKPIAVVLHFAVSHDGRALMDEMQSKLVSLNLPVFPSFSRAASAIRKYIDYIHGHGHS